MIKIIFKMILKTFVIMHQMERCANFNQISLWVQLRCCGTCAIWRTTDYEEPLIRVNILWDRRSTSMFVTQEWLTTTRRVYLHCSDVKILFIGSWMTKWNLPKTWWKRLLGVIVKGAVSYRNRYPLEFLELNMTAQA